MEEKQLTKQLFINYLRELYIELSPEQLKWIKSECAKIQSESWNIVLHDQNLAKGLLSYYLVSKKCPEYKILTTTDLIDHRFDDEENSIKDLIHFPGILILRHSTAFIRNKLMFETVMNIVSERAYRSKSIIVVSDVTKDEGGYLYYSQDAVSKFIPAVLAGNSSIVSSVTSTGGSNSKPKCTTKGSSKPLANRNIDRVTKESQMSERAKSIEEGAKNAV